MRLVFWLNSFSPHQLPYISKLSSDSRIDSVIVVAGYGVSETRKNMGWNMYEIDEKKCRTYIAPEDKVIEQLLSETPQNSVHLFSGIRGFAYVYNAFVRSLKYDVKRGIITEMPDTYAFGFANGKPLWLHKLRFRIQDNKYVSYIDYVFTIGERCYDYYKSLSDKWMLFPFAYCTKQNVDLSIDIVSTPQVLYVGSLSRRKSVKSLICVSDDTFDLNIVGDGAEREKLEKMMAKRNAKNISFLGTRSNTEVPHIMAANDILVLPSIYDGWGAVVNEALMMGMYVICSDKCGAKDLLRDKKLGLVFKWGDINDLSMCMHYATSHIDKIREYRNWRKQWAIEHISGEIVSKYMVDCLLEKNVIIPWRN